jgi:hypothetical protein
VATDAENVTGPDLVGQVSVVPCRDSVGGEFYTNL